MESQVKTINEDVLYAELPEGGFSVQDYVQLFDGTDFSLRAKFDGIYLESMNDSYKVEIGDLLVREGNTVSKWDREAFEEEFNTQI